MSSSILRRWLRRIAIGLLLFVAVVGVGRLIQVA